jgi:hypothetical protein
MEKGKDTKTKDVDVPDSCSVTIIITLYSLLNFPFTPAFTPTVGMQWRQYQYW